LRYAGAHANDPRGDRTASKASPDRLDGIRNASIDVTAAEARCVQVVHTGYTSAPTIELTWALILAGARHIVDENTSLRVAGWR
jgi:hypothetical protein